MGPKIYMIRAFLHCAQAFVLLVLLTLWNGVKGDPGVGAWTFMILFSTIFLRKTERDLTNRPPRIYTIGLLNRGPFERSCWRFLGIFWSLILYLNVFLILAGPGFSVHRVLRRVTHGNQMCDRCWVSRYLYRSHGFWIGGEGLYHWRRYRLRH